jgi:hypothetical protein
MRTQFTLDRPMERWPSFFAICAFLCGGFSPCRERLSSHGRFCCETIVLHLVRRLERWYIHDGSKLIKGQGRNTMQKSIKFGMIGGALLGAGLFVTSTPVRAATFSGSNGVVLASYSNPFDPNNDGVSGGADMPTMTSGAIGAGTVVPQYNLEYLVNRIDGRTESGVARMADTGWSSDQLFHAVPSGVVIQSRHRHRLPVH